ncbi:calcium-binding protein [Natrarchaeobius halalkaliphilus]|uniref:Calcium-binding protein n=1 Tax=Natrarchaeobius halalkaliphilus TaxID=1679091 RepID=A0A3N6MCH9_9EURY|nr:calcium-binding protein [Natrarchaeobius halalkaliphilus]RQG91436.1 calcium-binding protein [Natrarchaeobius halalkaliphilus]
MSDDTNPSGDSRRSVMKKGALAATALAVGTGATATTTAAQEEDGEVVVSGHDYYPDTDFDVLAEFESGTRDDILESDNLEGEFDDVGDWDVYAVSFDVGSGGILGYFMVDEGDADISAGDTGSMTGTASFRNAEANLLEVDVTTEAAEDDPEDDEADAEDDEADNDESEDDEEA